MLLIEIYSVVFIAIECRATDVNVCLPFTFRKHIMNNLPAREFHTIVGGGVLLAMNAGYINVVSMTGLFSVTVSHVTGSVTRISILLYNQEFELLIFVASIVLSFMFGAFVAGYSVGDNKFKLSGILNLI